MRSTTSPRMHVVRKEDKEARLKEFILKDIESRASAVGPTRYRLIALSIESPVAKALISLADTAIAAGISIEAVFIRADSGHEAGVQTGYWPGATCRHASDVRLLDAHEQLLLGTANVWIGDCMRRDPAKRDAYECYAEGCQETVSWGLRSFDRIWRAAQPITMTAPAARTDLMIAPEVADAAMSTNNEAGDTTAATRH